MNAFLKTASLAVGTASMAFSSPAMAQNSDTTDDLIFVPPMNGKFDELEIISPEAQQNSESSRIVGTPIIIEAGQCAYVLSFNFVATEHGQQENIERQFELDNWIDDNQSGLREAINLTSIYSINTVAQQGFNPVDVCDQKNVEAQNALITAFTAASSAFIDSIKDNFPDVINNVHINMNLDWYSVGQATPTSAIPAANIT